MNTPSVSLRPWQHAYLYGALFWILMALIFFADAHFAAAREHSGNVAFLWQLGFIFVTWGYLTGRVPPERRVAFNKPDAASILIVFIGPLTIPGYLWYWYGWRRSLRFVLFTFLYFLVFVALLALVNAVLPGTFDL